MHIYFNIWNIHFHFHEFEYVLVLFERTTKKINHSILIHVHWMKDDDMKKQIWNFFST